MKKGFTLIEVMVVAVIVAILAAVAVPAYQKYIDDAAMQVAQNMAATVAAEAAALVASKGDITEASVQGLKAWTTGVANAQISSISVSLNGDNQTGVITVTPTRSGTGVSAQSTAF
ncbi:MAG: hypothetical protein CR982_05815 [Candidatus Cloacimonadota bacterium]|nr:MAG: hypothetical protein CR982_05815 [Candidatus Cloacimonadota bacterium]